MKVTVAIIAKIEQVTASFEAELVVTFLRGEGSLETGELLVLELVGGEEDTLAFFFFAFFASYQSKSDFFSLWYINNYLNIRRQC